LYSLIERPLLCRVHSRVLDADPEYVLLFDNLSGIADPKVELPKIEAYYARRRRRRARRNLANQALGSPPGEDEASPEAGRARTREEGSASQRPR